LARTARRTPRKAKARPAKAPDKRDTATATPVAAAIQAVPAAAAAAPAAPAAAEATGISGLYMGIDAASDELRLDVDGHNPQLTVSGLFVSGLADRLHWIAKLTPTGAVNSWAGDIWFRDGTSSLLPHTRVDISVAQSGASFQATVKFSGAVTDLVRTYRRKSLYFHPIEFEFAVVQGTFSTMSMDTGAHPNHPTDLVAETLTIETVFQRAGFDVSVSGHQGSVPLSLAGANQTWSNTELHDAMQAYWTRFADKPQWALWVLFAARHDDGRGLGGIMFDDIGSNHRQGTAMFNDSFIADVPAGDSAPEPWRRRMRFWTIVHEMGHAFNLAHSWQESLGTPWIPLEDEPEGRTFMNYPYNVDGGQTAFFSDFYYRFSDQELLFMRHAPERFVEMGNANWFDNHAFRQAEVSPEPKFQLALRSNRDDPRFDFMEPCMLELKVTNISEDPQIVGEHLLQSSERMVVIIKRDGAPARRWLPFAQYCYKNTKTVLMPGASKYDSIFVAAGRNGWELAEPGNYTVQALLRISGEDVVSNKLRLRILPPRNYDDERLAQDYFSEDVGRVYAFDGSRVMASANNVLKQTVAQMPNRPAARHALIALGHPLAKDGKVLAATPDDADNPQSMTPDSGIEIARGRPDDATDEMKKALLNDANGAAETLGHIDFRAYSDYLSDALAAEGEKAEAVKVQDNLYNTLRQRGVPAAILADIKKRRDSY